MASAESKDMDIRTLWDEMLTNDLVDNLQQIAKSGISVPSLRAKLLLKVTFSELRARIIETKTATEKLEVEKVKNEVLEADNKSMQNELEQTKQLLTELENENKLLKEGRLKRLSEERDSELEKKLKLEVKQEQPSFFVPDTNLDISPLKTPLKLTVPESLSQEDFFLLTPPKKESPIDFTQVTSPIITKRCSSAASTSSKASPAPLSPQNGQSKPGCSTALQHPKKKTSKLSLKKIEVISKIPNTPASDMDRTYFDEEEEFKLFDSPETERKKKQENAKKAEEPAFGHFRGEVVRKKEERQKLPGWECHDCQKFYDNFCDGMSTQTKRDIVNRCSKHKQVQPVMGNTPDGFWDLGIIKSPKVGTTQTGKLVSRKVKKVGVLNTAISLEDDLDWA